MKFAAILIVALAASLSAQVATPPLSFDAGKSLAITPGAWSYVPNAGGSEARYGNVLIIRCSRASRVVQVIRVGSPNQPLTVSTSAVTRTLPSTGTLYANDTLLDAIAFSRGRFLVSGGMGPVLAIPSWPEAARAVEDCRI